MVKKVRLLWCSLAWTPRRGGGESPWKRRSHLIDVPKSKNEKYSHVSLGGNNIQVEFTSLPRDFWGSNGRVMALHGKQENIFKCKKIVRTKLQVVASKKLFRV